MKTRCPCCGTTVSLDTLVAHEGAREALSAAFKLSGALGSALVRYIAMHRPDARDLSLERVAKLINELLPDIQAGRIQRNGQVFDAPLEAWVWAIEQGVAARDAGRLKTPLKGHGWLYEVISGYRPQASTLVVAAGQHVGGGRRPATAREGRLQDALRHRGAGGFQAWRPMNGSEPKSPRACRSCSRCACKAHRQRMPSSARRKCGWKPCGPTARGRNTSTRRASARPFASSFASATNGRRRSCFSKTSAADRSRSSCRHPLSRRSRPRSTARALPN